MPKNRPAVVLVHGYTGSPSDLAGLAEDLAEAFGSDCVRNVRLPGHGYTASVPRFDPALFLETIESAISTLLDEGSKLVLIGHSTGGALLLSLLSQRSHSPELLVLAGTPHRIGPADFLRWEDHRTGQPEVAFSSIARMVSFTNSIDAGQIDGKTNVLILHGLRDRLVLPRTPSCWTANDFPGPARQIMLPQADHRLFEGDGGAIARDVLKKAISDALSETSHEDQITLKTISEFEPEVDAFLAQSPGSSRHLAACPSGRKLPNLPFQLVPEVDTEPVFANIEITTRCNLSCPHCARTWLAPRQQDMSVEVFQRVLERLPHAYRITLVGLGEPLLHPAIVDFIAIATGEWRRVGLVTNGMNLDDSLSDKLLDAGLRSIAFSLDAHEQGLASEVRPGTYLQRVLQNIEGFVQKARQRSGISTAIFSVLSTKNVDHLAGLVDLAARLKVHVLMLTDLNFRENVGSSLWGNRGESTGLELKGLQQNVLLAFAKGLPVISVDGLEAFGLFKTYRDYLLLSPVRIITRSNGHCRSPWQTVPVSVTGDVSLCDCQPEERLGNLIQDPLSSIWNGPGMTAHRTAMLGPEPPEACRLCPRF